MVRNTRKISMVTLYIYYSDNVYTPAVFACDMQAAWRLHFTLTKSMKRGESGPHVERVEIRDNGRVIPTDKGLPNAYCNLTQQLNIN